MKKSELRQLIREMLKEELSRTNLKEDAEAPEKLAIVLLGDLHNKSLLNKLSEPRRKVLNSARDFIKEYDNTRFDGIEKGLVKLYADIEGMSELEDQLSDAPARIADPILKATTILN